MIESTTEEFLKNNGLYCTILHDTVIDLNAKRVLELGVGPGYSTTAILAGLKQTGGTLFSIDIQLSNGIFEGIKNIQSRPFINPKKWVFILADDLEIAKIWSLPIDMLYIDSSHFYDNTLQELELFTPWLRKDGTLLMHDTVCKGVWTDNNITGTFGVKEAIDTFTTTRKEWMFEELYPDDPGGCGMGKLTRKLI